MKDSEQRVDFAAGVQLFAEGDTADYAYIIQSGMVEIAFDRQGERVVVAQLGQGELFGEMALVNGDRRSASATALTDVRVSRISRVELHAKMAVADPVVNLFMRVLLDRLRELASREKRTWASQPAEQEVAYANELEHIVDALRTRDQILEGIEGNQFRLFYQPLTDFKTGKTVGFEALIRWQHPERGLLSPIAFIEFAEKENLIVPLGTWILFEACRAATRFRPLFASDTTFFISINVAATQLLQPDFLQLCAAAIKESGVDPSCIKIEVTESILLADPEQAKKILHEAKRELGVSLAMDDFGTGYSSLSYLHQFPFDTLKIDQSFVGTMCQKPSSLEIVRCVIAMAKALNMKVVAEGVETQQNAEMLIELGCDFGQGYLYAKPMPEEEAAHFVVQT